MARIEKDDLEMLKGLIGGVVLTKWKGMPIVRSRPARKKKPGSAKQLFQQQKMRVAMQFLKPFKGLIDLYFGEPQEIKTRLIWLRHITCKKGY